MQENFLPIILPMTLREEGGRANNPKDPGGRTNHGITQATYWAWLDKRGQDHRDVFNISEAEVSAIYAERYWATVSGPALASGPDLAAFDCGVMSGPGRANAFVKAYGGVAKVNGSPGPAAKFICDKRLGFVMGLRTATTFGKGWSARIARIRAKAMVMATHQLQSIPATAPPSPAAKAILRSEAAKASAKAKTRASNAKGAGGGAAAGGVATAGVGADPAAVPLSVVLIMAGAVLLCVLLAAYLAWRASIHNEVAKASEQEALGLTPSPEPA